ncbi:MAG: formylglycine-generating enzyme family protein [Nitrospirae bacterium YQR-1]
MLIVVVLCDLPTTFSITAQVERVEFITDDNQSIEWSLKNSVILENGDDSSKRTFTGLLTIETASNVIVERVSNGPLTISINSMQDNKTVGTFLSENDLTSTQAGKKIGITIDNITKYVNNGQTILLPIIGKDVRLGITIWNRLRGSTAILRSGKVTMLGKTILSDVFNVGENTLDAGDQIKVEDEESLSYGFVLLDERAAMTASYRAIGKQAKITRPGGHNYSISTTIYNRLMKDTFVIALWAILGAIIAAYTFLFKKEKTSGLPLLRCYCFALKRNKLQMRNKFFIIACLMYLLFQTADLFAEEVFIKTNIQQVGRGITKLFEGECIVITPKHIVENANPPVEVYFPLPYNKKVTGNPKIFVGLDIALITLDSNNLRCSTYNITTNFDKLIKNITSGQLIITDESGVTIRESVKIISTYLDTIKIRPDNTSFILKKGHSGSALYAVDKNGELFLAGILLTFDREEGTGSVFRIDYIDRNVLSAFKKPPIPTLSPTPPPPPSYEPEMVLVPGDKSIGIQSFYISKHEITFEAYDYYCEEMKIKKPDNKGIPLNKKYPVFNVRYDEAVRFTQWLSDKTKETYRLPQKEEWLRACRYKGGGKYPWGTDNSTKIVKLYANYSETRKEEPNIVGSYKATGVGIYDMAGNVFEWIGDSDEPSRRGLHYIAGGSYDQSIPYLECDNFTLSYGEAKSYIGFRVVREIK